MADDDQTEIIVAAAALVVSVIAFTATLMQCLQQYYASARGYSHCNEKVIGEWAKTKSRRFSLEELRFEVQFDAPVIFVCPPKNQNAPVPDAPMFRLDGTKKSLQDTWTTYNMSHRQEYQSRSPKERIHTSDNERASWTILLSAIQCMENESREWHESEFEYDADEPPKAIFTQHNLPNQPPSLESSHTLVVALQRKRKSWDTMPAAITKPYATTTMCHLVEMMAVLGVYWKEFNRRNDRYRAEGNGFMVLGERISDFGLMFSFQVNGLSRFGQNRVIPVDEIKELCFGWVPTIYRSTQDKRRLEVPIDLLDMSSLQMGSNAEIAGTLRMIGCNNNAVNNYLEEGKRTSHLFPVSFEILGMLSQTFHIENTYFTYIPNPTPDRWDNRSVSIVQMMESFKKRFALDLPDVPRNQHVVTRLTHHMNEILKHQEEQNVETLLRFRALHRALDDADEILTGRTKASRAPPPEDVTESSPGASTDSIGNQANGLGIRRRLTSMLPNQNSKRNPSMLGAKKPKTKKKAAPPGLSPETPLQRQRREKVQDVLRNHIQTVLRLINDREEPYSDNSLYPWGHTRSRSRSRSPINIRSPDAVLIDDVDIAEPDTRQDVLMKLYCNDVRREVVQIAGQSAIRRASQSVPFGRRGSGASDTPVSPTHVGVAVSQEVPNVADGSIPLSHMAPAPAKAAIRIQIAKPVEEDMTGPLAHLDMSYDDIWCTLVFRMICWLMLHDFNKLDIQVPKSELLGSRMPVYVA